MKIDSESGWLFPGERSNEVHEITEEDLRHLFAMAEGEDRWAERLKQEVAERDRSIRAGTWDSGGRVEWMLDEIRILNTCGTVVPFPYGLRIITFPSKRHLFRGENRKYAATVPSLNRAIDGLQDPREKELYRVVSYLRKWQFAGLLWQINVVPYWEAKLCDVNFDALAQHYGFQTHLLDLTNDFKTALFFATCKYDYATDSYLPLTDQDINRREETKYGYIFHSPDWVIDYLNGGGFSDWSYKHLHNEETTGGPNQRERFYLQSGDMDGVALQIGYQPLYRCHHQSGYIFPMRNEAPLQQNKKFEKLRFRQSVELSNCVYELMDQGKKVFPNEGITEIRDMVEQLKHSIVFSMEEVEMSYENDGVDRAIFPSAEELRAALQGFQMPEGKVEIKDEAIVHRIPPELLEKVNGHYDGKDLLEQIGGMIHQKYPDEEYRKNRCIEIYGKPI